MNLSQARQGATASLFRSANFRRLWLLGGIANAMRWVEMLASGLFVFGLTGSGADVAFVLAIRSLPMLLLGAVAGVLADSIDRKRILFYGMLLSMAAATTICALATIGLARPWHLAVAAFVSGTVWATEMSVRRRMIAECGGPALISRVIALDSITSSLARMAGPLIGSLAFAAAGLAGAYAITAACYGIGAFLVPGVAHAQPARPLLLLHIPRELAAGLRYALRQPAIRAVLGVTAAMNMFAFSYTALVAPIALRGFGVSDAVVGLLPAGEPLGALLGGMALAVWTPRSNPRILMLAGSATFMAALAAMPLMPSFAAACVILTLGGLGLAVFGNMQTTLVLTSTQAAYRSRQMGLLTVCIGFSPLGQMLIGLLAEAAGPLLAVTTSALLGLAALAAIAWMSTGGGTMPGDPK